MDHSYILPFIKSITNVFETMLQSHVSVGKPSLKASGQPCYDVSGIIGMSGDVEGTIVLSFPTDVAVTCVAKFVGMEIPVEHEDFADAIGELVNMVTGNAKAEFQDKKVNITCPSVVVGQDHIVFGSKEVVCIDIPCECEYGNFVVEVGLKQGTGAAKDSVAEVSAA